jgi:hypothetical protein
MKNSPRSTRFAVSALLAAIISCGALAQTTPPPDDTPVVVIEDRALRQRSDERAFTLDQPLSIVDANGAEVIALPVGTSVGREKTEQRFAGPDQLIRQRTDLRNVTLSEAVSVTDRRTGETVALPEGTVLRVKVDQRMDASGNVLRDRVDLRAVLPDGTRVRIRDRAPEIEAVEVENEVETADRHRQRGRDTARPEDNSSAPRVATVERSGRSERVGIDRSGRSDRPDRPDREDRSGSSGRR